MKDTAKGFLKVLVSFSLVIIVAAACGYYLYLFLVRSDKRHEVAKFLGKKTSRSSSSKRKRMSSSRARTSGVIKSTKPAGSARTTKPKTSSNPRHEELLRMLSGGKEVKMSEIGKRFPDVTSRTLRRDMDKLVDQGLVEKRGTTRSTTYVEK